MKKVLFVTQNRKDAIGIVDGEIKKELYDLPNNFVFLQLNKKGEKKYEIIANYIVNIFRLLYTSFFYKKIYFSWENPYVIFVKIFFPLKYIYICVHHVEDYRGKSIIGKLIIKSVHKFIAISIFTKNQIVELGVSPKRIVVNYNGISADFFPERINNFQKFKYILYVGSELERKNIKNLLLAFNEVIEAYPALKLIKIGESHGGKEMTDKWIQKLGLEDHVIMIRKFLSIVDLRKYYSNAVCYVSVSTLEGFGLTIPEAMACGCPVVASNIGPFREIIGDSQILVDPNNIEDISNGIIKYIKNDSFNKEMSLEGIKISQRFQRGQNIKSLDSILNQ